MMWGNGSHVSPTPPYHDAVYPAYSGVVNNRNENMSQRGIKPSVFLFLGKSVKLTFLKNNAFAYAGFIVYLFSSKTFFISSSTFLASVAFGISSHWE